MSFDPAGVKGEVMLARPWLGYRGMQSEDRSVAQYSLSCLKLNQFSSMLHYFFL